jgi:fluoride exporter
VIWLVVALAGGAGAAARYVVDAAVTARTRSAHPWGMTVVNVSGSALAGWVVGIGAQGLLPAHLQTVVAGGFLGAYTSFSTAMVETVRLAEQGRFDRAALHLVGQLVAAVAAAAIGVWLAGGA